MKTVPVITQFDHDIVCSTLQLRSLILASAWEVRIVPETQAAILLRIDLDGMNRNFVDVALSPPAAKQIAKALNIAVKAHLHGEETG